jgi:hypothetical protein
MTVIDKDANQVRLRLEQEERDSLLTLLTFGEGQGHPKRELSRTSLDELPDEANELLEDSLREQRTQLFETLRSLLMSSSQHSATLSATPSDSSDLNKSESKPISPRRRKAPFHVLTLAWNDIDLFLKAINWIRVNAWMELGAPDLQKGNFPEANDINLVRLWMIQFSEGILHTLLQLLERED